MTSMTEGCGRATIRIPQTAYPLKRYSKEHDPLHVRALLLRQESAVLFLSIEMTSLPDHAIKTVKEAASEQSGVLENHIYVSVTHSFSSPHIPPAPKDAMEEKVTDVLMRSLLTAVREALLQAMENLSPCTVQYGEGWCTANINRNVETEEGWWIGQNPAGYSNHLLYLLRFEKEGRTDCDLWNFDLQSSILNQLPDQDGTLVISSDAVGRACRDLEEDGRVSIFLPGAAGDQAPKEKAENLTEGFTKVRRCAEELEQAVKAIHPKAVTGELAIASKAAALPRQEMPIPTKDLKPTHSFRFVREASFQNVTLDLVKIGDVTLLLTQPEMNSSYGKQVRELLGEKTLLGTLVNGGCKYLPEEEDYEKITYTAMNTMLARGDDAVFLENVKEAKKKL